MRRRLLSAIIALASLIGTPALAQTYSAPIFSKLEFTNPSAPAGSRKWAWIVYNDGYGSAALATLDDNNAVMDNPLVCYRTGLLSAGCEIFGPLWTKSFQIGGSGINADSTTDMAPAINAALAATGYVKLAPTQGKAFYRAASTIVVPAGATLEGQGISSPSTSFTPPSDYGVVGGAKIVCDALVSPCIQVGQNTQGGKSTGLFNIAQSRAGSTPIAGTGFIGIQFMGGFNSRASNVQADNNAVCFAFKTPPGTGDGISFMGDHLYGYRCSDAHIWQDEWPEARINQSRFGENGDVASNTFIRISCSRHDCAGAAASNGLEIVNSQFNSNGPAVGKFIELVNNGTAVEGGQDAELPILTSIHAENFNQFMTSDSSWDILRGMKITNSSFYVNTDTFALDPASGIDDWNIVNTNFFAATGSFTFNINPSGNSTYNGTKRAITKLQWLGGTIGGVGHVTGQGNTNSMASFIGVSHGGNFTIDGRWANLNVIGGNWWGGNLVDSTNTADDVTIMENGILKFHGARGVNCTAGISATTGRASNGILTAC